MLFGIFPLHVIGDAVTIYTIGKTPLVKRLHPFRAAHDEEVTEPSAELIQTRKSVLLAAFQSGSDFLVKIFKDGLSCGGHLLIDSLGQFFLQLVKLMLYLACCLAGLVYFGDALLEIHAGFDRAKHLIRGAKQAAEQTEFLVEQFINTYIGGILLVEEVDNHHVIFLPIPMAATDALLNALRVPRQVVVHYQAAEL